MKLLRWLMGRGDIPEGFTGKLAADERVLATAELAHAAERHLVVTSWGIWLPEQAGPRRVGWHLVSKATWRDGVLTVTEAEEVSEISADDAAAPTAVLLADRPPVRLRLAVPNRVPETVRARVEASIRSRHHRELPTGGAWFVQRRVPGRDGVVLQVRPDPGTDPDSVRQLTEEVVRKLGTSR